MRNCERYKYFQSLVEHFQDGGSDQFLDTTVRLGDGGTFRCSRLALGAVSPCLRAALAEDEQEEDALILVPEAVGVEATALARLLTFAREGEEEKTELQDLLEPFMISLGLFLELHSSVEHSLKPEEEPLEEDELATVRTKEDDKQHPTEVDHLTSIGSPVLDQIALGAEPLFLTSPVPPPPHLPLAVKLFPCDRCGSNFPSGRQLLQHKGSTCSAPLDASLSPNVPAGGLGTKYACSICDAWLANKSSLELHLRTHSGYRPFACDRCGKSFTSAAYLRQHSVFHNAAKEYECEQCGKRYQNANSLHQHRRDSHSSATKVSCPDCGKIFSALRYLTEHQARKHSAAFRRPACRICGKTFAGRTELATHQTVHTGERPFECQACGKSFRLKAVLRMHMRSHAGERSAVCDTCGKRFLHASDLNKHKLATHSGEKPFACEVCARPFARRDYLKAHMKVHQQQHHLMDEVGIGLTSGRNPRTTRKRYYRAAMNDMIEQEQMVGDDRVEEGQPAVYSPDIEQSLILDVPMTLTSIVEGSETLLVVTNLDDSKDLVIEEFKPDSLMVNTSFL